MPKVRVKFPLCLGEYTPSNTVTGRTGQPLWLTVPAATSHKAGSEIQSKVMAPPGYSLVGFDFSSQELVLFALLGDMAQGCAGSTPLSYSVLAGSKDTGTDYHSVVAKQSAIDRGDAKTAVYASVYGCSARKLAQGFWTSNKLRSIADCKKDADRFLLAMKGKRVKGTKMWTGGSASASFNRITQIVNSEQPFECALGRLASTASRPAVVGNDFITGRSNFPIQAAAASMLHIVLVKLEWLVKQDSSMPSERAYWLSHTVHDAVVYCVRNDIINRFALHLITAHLYAYAAVCYNLGIDHIPASIAYPDCVDVSKVWRKTAKYPSVTVTQPTEPAPFGYELTPTQIL